MEEPTILTNDEKPPLPPKITKETINSFSESPKGKILQLLRTALYTVLSAALIAISVHCFITPNNFTVGGAKLESYTADVDTDAAFTPDTEAIVNGYFAESAERSAPYFDVEIDGITLINRKY